MRRSMLEETAYLVKVNLLYDGEPDWAHRDVRRTIALRRICDSPMDAFDKLLRGEQALIAHSDIVPVEKLIYEYQMGRRSLYGYDSIPATDRANTSSRPKD